VVEWVRAGSSREDDPPRFVNHFHNPLRTWDQAGLRILGAQVGNSSVLWGQRPDLQPSDARFTWQDARLNFFQGLTATNQAEREAHLALTFRALGQLIHLVQDAAVPAHTRNDPHSIWEGLERFVNGVQTADPTLATLIPGVTGFDPSILALPPNPLAPIPIARIIDTTDPEQAAAFPSAGTNVGLAEYSNANFLSGDTILKDFAFPRVESLGVPFDGTEPVTGKPRQYFPKVADGQTGFRLVAKGTWTERLIAVAAGDQGFILDRGVYEDYARLLLPRAIGYSAGLLDYFVRGRIEIAAPDRFVYGLAPFVDGNTGAFTKLMFKVRNATPDDETTCPSAQTCAPPKLTAVVQYRKPVRDAILNPGDDLPDALSFAIAQPQVVTLTRTFQELTFDFSSSPIPTNAADVFLTVVYQGPLGLEPEAVAVGGKDLFEPDPVTIANVTDYFCFNGALFHVSDFTAFPPFDLTNPNPVTNPQPRDLNKDGFPDLFGPDDEFGMFTKASSLFTFPSPTNFDHQLAQRTFAQFTRFFLLQDQPVYILSRLVQTIVERGLFLNASSFKVFAVVNQGILNRLIVRPDGTVAHEFTDSFTYRGLPTLAIRLFVPQGLSSFLPCLAASFTLDPPLTRIEGTLAGP
jgi:hypothetical protein